jgi:hypothetical protein
MTLQNFGQPLSLVAASACKCGGRMTLQKSAFKWLHEAANWQQGGRGGVTVLAAITPDGRPGRPAALGPAASPRLAGVSHAVLTSVAAELRCIAWRRRRWFMSDWMSA